MGDYYFRKIVKTKVLTNQKIIC
jgi:hypothetical protein